VTKDWINKELSVPEKDEGFDFWLDGFGVFLFYFFSAVYYSSGLVVPYKSQVSEN